MIKEVIIKKLQGEEIAIQIKENDTFYDVKKNIFRQLGIPIWRQKLIFQGKLLNDDSSVSEYKTLGEGSKLNLLVGDPEPLDICLKKLFKKYYSEEESKKYADEVNKEIQTALENMSWDDIKHVMKYYQDEDEKILNENPSQAV